MILKKLMVKAQAIFARLPSKFAKSVYMLDIFYTWKFKMGIRNAEVDVFLLISKPLKKFLQKYSPQIIKDRKLLHIE